MLTFSDFVQILHVRIGGDESIAEFLVSLTDKIMTESFSEDNNPLYDKKEETLRKISIGERELSKKDARIMLQQIDREGFKKYLSGFSDDVRALLYGDLRRYEATVAGTDVVTICTNLFVQVLDNCAKGVDRLGHTGAEKKRSLLEEIDLINQEETFNRARNLYIRAQDNKQIADQLREIFVSDGRRYSLKQINNSSP